MYLSRSISWLCMENCKEINDAWSIHNLWNIGYVTQQNITFGTKYHFWDIQEIYWDNEFFLKPLENSVVVFLLSGFIDLCEKPRESELVKSNSVCLDLHLAEVF